MRTSKKLLICLFSTVLYIQTLFCAIPSAPHVPIQGAQASSATPPMSNEEQLLAQQLDSVFEELTKGMSENEKNQFFNELNTAMEEEIDKMSKMSEDELTKYIQDAEKEFQDLGLTPEVPAQPQPAQHPVTPQEPIRPPVIEKEEVKKPSRDMVPTLDEIAARLDSFIQKANQVVEMAANFEKWGKKGKLHGWNPTMTWAVFKEKIESLKKKLLEIKSLDPKTQRPKYLVDLAANEALCNNLHQFKTVLAKHEPGTQAPSFGLKKLSKSSKNAFIAVINDCLEALLALNLPSEIDKIIAKYEPTAKKLKEAEERAQQAALESSKHHPIRPSTMATTVKGHEEAGYYQYGIPGAKPGYAQYQPMSPYLPEKAGEHEGKSKEEDGTKSQEKGKPGEKPEEKKKDEKPGPSSKKEDVKDTEATKAIDRLCTDFVLKLEDAREEMQLNLTNMQAKAKSKDLKSLTELAGSIKAATSKVSAATKVAKQADSLLSRLDNGPQKEKLTKCFKDVWSDFVQDFTRWQNLAQRTAI
jgi:hypothetical protein